MPDPAILEPNYKGNLKTKIISIIISEDFFSIKHDLARLCFMLYTPSLSNFRGAMKMLNFC